MKLDADEKELLDSVEHVFGARSSAQVFRGDGPGG